jgi:hypothetical protein
MELQHQQRYCIHNYTPESRDGLPFLAYVLTLPSISRISIAPYSRRYTLTTLALFTALDQPCIPQAKRSRHYITHSHAKHENVGRRIT